MLCDTENARTATLTKSRIRGMVVWCGQAKGIYVCDVSVCISHACVWYVAEWKRGRRELNSRTYLVDQQHLAEISSALVSKKRSLPDV